MRLLVSASDSQEMFDLLTQEGVTYQQRLFESVRELGTGSYEIYEISANLPEVRVPPEFVSSEGEVRAFRLPSGRLILTDLEGNLERVAMPSAPR